jgi:hypothetical protein
MFSNLKELAIPEGIVVKIMSGSVLLWEKSSLLPSIYQRVSYIATDGNQYIDTGIKASDYQEGLEYIFSGSCTGLSSSKNNNYLFGCLASSKRSGNITWMGNQNTLVLMAGGNGNNIYNIAAPELNADFTIKARGTSRDIGNFTTTLDNALFNRSAYSYANSDMPSSNIFVLAANINGSYISSSSASFTGKLYGFTMANMNGEEIRNYIPCYRKADGVIGLYDVVEGKFYTNKGTGNFTAPV